jgi:tRNA-splicing ligase RtcB
MSYKIYADVLEDAALEQFKSAMELDCVVDGALMPDAHAGYALPIGAVVRTKGVVFPSWVGYDIGCGMCAVKLDVTKDMFLEELASYRYSMEMLHELISKRIPLGFNHRKVPSEFADFEGLLKLYRSRTATDIWMKKGAELQLGTLGGGNHFIELGSDEEGSLWIVIHSGSRGFGHGVAEHYMRLASGDGKAREGHYGFHKGTDLFNDYMADVWFCQEYALENRRVMIKHVMSIISSIFGYEVLQKQFINRNHNHAEFMNDDTIIHRKGATHADKGMLGVIPGNMRDGSFIVVGLGNEDWLNSSSHGAGRVLGRKEAKRVLSMEEFKGTMKGIVGTVDEDRLDESPMAYKNIFDVMDLQKDSVEVLHHIIPLINVKG